MFLFNFNALSCSGIININAGSSAGYVSIFRHPKFGLTGCLSM